LILSWDIALSEKVAADYSAFVVLLNRGDLYYVLDVIRGKFPFNKLIDKIIEVKERYGKATSLACSPNLCLWLKAPNSGFHVNAEYKRCAPLMTRNNANNPANTREGSQCATATPRRTVTSVPATRAASAGKLM
jgi:hypothetical protein